MQRAKVPLPAEEAARRKRSATVSLVLVAGAGAAAFGLGRIDPSQREEDALVYETLAACVAQQLRSADACTNGYKTAQAAYAEAAPRYPTLAECERHHGPGGCVPGETASLAARGSFVPVMAGYMLGRTDAQALPAQPLYRHAPDDEHHASGSAGGYCTGAGGRVYASGGGSVARVSSSVARTTTSSHSVSRGGFGATGRSISASSGRAGGFGGG